MKLAPYRFLYPSAAPAWTFAITGHARESGAAAFARPASLDQHAALKQCVVLAGHRKPSFRI